MVLLTTIYYCMVFTMFLEPWKHHKSLWIKKRQKNTWFLVLFQLPWSPMGRGPLLVRAVGGSGLAEPAGPPKPQPISKTYENTMVLIVF